MPWQTRWSEPEVAVDYKGVKVYHTYRRDDVDNAVSDHFYTLDPNSDGYEFDVRDLPSWRGDPPPNTMQERLEIIKEAIDLGYFKGKEVK